ncbi:hypothetical protein GWK47_025902 [Chionoecetes opilio]|uniref:Uncharacterized protein n=1 Tax=Chionoecetes opilio TaxID=41210 RepID=A0A8J8WDG9_CHIOP|nr:hypothetical protein GWK47_025902 [Chionoecetes opilio]
MPPCSSDRGISPEATGASPPRAEEVLWRAALTRGRTTKNSSGSRVPVLGDLGKDYRFRPQVPSTKPRVMATGIYALKVLSSSEVQVKLTAHDLQVMGDISRFMALLNATKWNEGHLPQRAPLNDLLLHERNLFSRDPQTRAGGRGAQAFPSSPLVRLRRTLWPAVLHGHKISMRRRKAMVRKPVQT